MDTSALASYRELENLDLLRDLDARSLHVTPDGLSWHDVRPPRLSASQLVELYHYMALTREVDREILKLLRKGLAPGKHLMCTGHEAIAVGACAAMRPEEWVAPAARDLGAFLVRGIPVADILAQACGRIPGLTDGWDASLHMGSRSARMTALISHLGTMVAIATGCAFAARFKGTGNAVLAFVGEGSTSTGDVHEALNIASVLRLPLVVVVENNQWAFGTPSRLQYSVPTLALRAMAYGRHVEGYWIDGTNVTTVLDTVHTAVERARDYQSIGIIEAVTMRLEGHSLADPFTTYVPAGQLARWKLKDPVVSFRDRLVTGGHATEDVLHAVERRIADQVRSAALVAEQRATPDAHDIERRVFMPSSVFGPTARHPPPTGARMTYHRAIRDALQEEMDRDPLLFMIGEDIGVSNGAFKITEGFSARYDGIHWRDFWQSSQAFPQRRVIDAPIAEAGFCGLALGAVLDGLRAVVEFQYADFASEAFKMLVNYAATQAVRCMGPVPVVFRLPSGWAPGASTYHSVNPESWFASTPGLKIVAPVTAFDAKGLMKAAIRDGNPVLYLEYKAYYRTPPVKLPPELNLPVPEKDYIVSIGQARVVRGGTDASVITYGSQVMRALEAARILEREDGVSVEVVDLRTLVPYDVERVRQSVEKTSRVLVTCEAPRTGCFGNTIVADIARTSFESLDAPIQLIAAADTPVPFSPVLEAAHLPTTGKLVQALRDLLAY